MRLAIWKYVLGLLAADVTISMPRGKIAAVQLQAGLPTLWVHVDLDDPNLTDRTFRIRGTGQVYTEKNDSSLNVLHIGTVQDGAYVWHIFEVSPQ